MAKIDRMTPGEILADVSVADFVRELAMGIATAQAELNKNSVDEFLRLAREPVAGLGKTAIELGLSPPFYHFQYADLEMKVHLCLRLSKDFGFGLAAAYDSGAAAGAAAAGTTVDSVTVTVIQGDGAPASASLLLRANAAGTVHVGDADFALVEGTASNPGEVEVETGLYLTAVDLRRAILDASATSKVNRIDLDVLPGNPAVLPKTSKPEVFACSANRVRIDWSDDPSPARAWFSVQASATSGEITLGHSASSGGGGSVSATSTFPIDAQASDPVGALAQAIEDHEDGGQKDYHAEVLVRDGVGTAPVYFDYADDWPRDDAGNLAALSGMLRFLLYNPAVKVRLDGHTDRRGGDTSNEKLGQRRADAIRTILEACGVPSAQLSTKTFGERRPVSGSGQAADYWKDRRVMFTLEAGPDDVIAVSTRASGQRWAGIDIDASLGTLLHALDGVAGVALAAGEWVQVDTTKLRVDTDFQKGTSPRETAAYLAEAINTTVPNHSAYAFDGVVHILGPGSMIRLILTTELEGSAANQTRLDGAGGSIGIERRFSGGADPADPAAGDTLTFGNVLLTCIDTGNSPAADQFVEGATAAETAASLGEAINHFDGISAAVAGNVVTITAPSGTSAATSNTRAFKLSSNRFGNRTESYAAAQSQARAFSASGDLHYNRKYDVSVEAMSTIKARMVAIPAPVEFLDEIRTYLLTWR